MQLIKGYLTKQYLQSWGRGKQLLQWPVFAQYVRSDDVHHSQTVPYEWGVPLYIILYHSSFLIPHLTWSFNNLVDGRTINRIWTQNRDVHQNVHHNCTPFSGWNHRQYILLNSTFLRCIRQESNSWKNYHNSRGGTDGRTCYFESFLSLLWIDLFLVMIISLYLVI